MRTKVSLVLFFNIQFSIFNLEYYGLYISTKLLVSSWYRYLYWEPCWCSCSLCRVATPCCSRLHAMTKNVRLAGKLHRTQVGVYFSPPHCRFRRRLLRFFPAVLQYQLPCVQFRIAGCLIPFQSKLGDLLGKRTYQWFLVINGIVGPLLLGGAVATFFTGSNFLVNKGNMGNELMPVISSWANGWHGLDALTNPWNLVLGFAVFFLARLLGNLCLFNNIRDKD